MNRLLNDLVDTTAKAIPGVYTVEYQSGKKGVEFTEEALEKFAKLLIKEVRIKAIEEVRQELKWADWPISCLSFVENACKNLSEKEPDQRYTR